MFTGIVRYCGTITGLSSYSPAAAEGQTMVIAVPVGFPKLPLGSSVSCNGMCLTINHCEDDVFSVDVSPESLRCTAAHQWRVGTPLNLEPALRVGEALDGHFVTGHVDATLQIKNVRSFIKFTEVDFSMNDKVKKYIAPKGSVTIDGVSLTVNSVSDDLFTVMIIPHTWKNTIFAHYQLGTLVNIEVDIVARYLARLLEVQS
ncbi:MAG: riboflavin synthase [Holosporales bacterium]|jgi:riboflavin synthase